MNQIRVFSMKCFVMKYYKPFSLPKYKFMPSMPISHSINTKQTALQKDPPEHYYFKQFLI